MAGRLDILVSTSVVAPGNYVPRPDTTADMAFYERDQNDSSWISSTTTTSCVFAMTQKLGGSGQYTLAANERINNARADVRAAGYDAGAGPQLNRIFWTWGNYATANMQPTDTIAVDTIQNFGGTFHPTWPAAVNGTTEITNANLSSMNLQLSSGVDNNGHTAVFYQIDVVVEVLTQPTVVITSPTGTNPGNTHFPTVSWNPTINDGFAQKSYQVKIFDLAVNPNPVFTDTNYFFHNGPVPTTATTLPLGVAFPNGSYRTLLQVSKDFHGTDWWSPTAQADFLINDAVLVPTNVGPTGTIPDSHPVLVATLAQSGFGGSAPVRGRWRIATDSGFTQNAHTFNESDAVADAGGVHALREPILLSQTTWYLQAAAVDTLGNVSAWSATVTFVVSHPLRAAGRSPDGAAFGPGPVTFLWALDDVEPTATQTAYQIIVQTQAGAAISDTGKITSTAQTATVNFPTINQLQWEIQLWDNDNIAGGFSSFLRFEIRKLGKWILTDPVGGTSFTFEINPTDGPALPSLKKHPGYANGLGPGGGALIFEQHDDATQISWNGTIWTQTMYDALTLWYQKQNAVNLTDDFGNVFTIYIEQFTPKRVKSQLPLEMTYTMSSVVLSSVFAGQIAPPPPPPPPPPPRTPTITSVAPTSGPVAGGTNITITGTAFTGTTAVQFGASPAASWTLVSDTSITATSPATAASTVNISVTTPVGTSAVTPADQFTFVGATPGPTVTNVVPNNGPAAGATAVTIIGTAFTGVTAVSFGSIPAASWTFNSDTSISAISPAGSGTVDVTVTTGVGTSPISTADQFAYASPPPPPPPPPSGTALVTETGVPIVTETGVPLVA